MTNERWVKDFDLLGSYEGPRWCLLLVAVPQRNLAFAEPSVDCREEHKKGGFSKKNQPAKGDVRRKRKRKIWHLIGQLNIHQRTEQQRAGPGGGALPERGGGDVVHQLGERQWVGGGAAAAAHRLERESRKVRGAP